MEMINETAVPQVKTLAATNDLHTQVFKSLAMRERAATRSDIDAIFRELELSLKKEIDYFKFIDVWKGLEAAGMGTLVHGRKGNPNRFVWKVNFKHMARKALGLPEEETPVFRTALRKAPKTEIPATVSPEPRTITFVIPDTVSQDDIKAFISIGASLAQKSK